MLPVYMQILSVDEKRTGVKDGRPWAMQEAQSMLLDADGQILKVGVYDLKRDEIDKMTPGLYMPRYALSIGNGDKTKGKVIPAFAGWTPMVKTPKGLVPADAAVGEAVSKAAAKSV
jgi:hypothetical protein